MNYYEGVTNILNSHKLNGFFARNLFESIAKIKNQKNSRSFYFMLIYYGWGDSKNLTLDQIGSLIEPKLTRERVRQIIESAVEILKSDKDNVFDRAYNLFVSFKGSREGYLKLSDFKSDRELKDWENNEQGLIDFLNDAGVRHVAYRGIGYLYDKKIKRGNAIEEIQNQNKIIRKAKTNEKASTMVKTVTYVPIEIKNKLALIAKKEEIGLNKLYEKALGEFIKEVSDGKIVSFNKTQSWKARKKKTPWCQIGLYINREVFSEIKKITDLLKKKKVDVSNMSFIYEAFTFIVDKKSES